MTHLKVSFSTAFMALMMLALVGCGSTDTESGTGEYFDDTVITTKVKAAIFAEDSLSSAEINVETFKGVVQLSGFVEDAEDAAHAESVTREVTGVKGVENDIETKD